MYKALITDLDGTAVKLSSDGSDVDEQTVQAVQAAIKNGKIIACATGRGWQIARPVVRALGLTAPCIVEGGTRIIDPKNGKSLWGKTMDNSSVALTLDIFKKLGPSGLFISSAHPQKTSFSKLGWFPDRMPDETSYMYLVNLPAQSAQKIAAAVNVHKLAAAHLTPSWQGKDLLDVHVTHREATKEHAVNVWHKIVGVSKAQTIGMGDSGNDIPIFESVGLKVAVGNATEDILQLADYVAPKHNEHALAHVIKKFL